MLRFFYKAVMKLIPLRLKSLVINKIISISRQAYSEEWATSTLIPLDQKIARIEAQLNALERYIKKDLLNEWVENSLIPLQQKIERISSKLADDSNEFLSAQEYFNFEKQFHQSFEAMDQQYKEMILSYVEPTDKLIEIGCGAGHLLRYLIDNLPKITVLGIDINPVMVNQAIELGVNAIHGDANEVIQQQKSDSVDLVLAIHIVEHLQLDYLRCLIENAYRILRSGGSLIIETPNIQSLYVMSHYYYADPSHMMPRHPSMIAFVLRSVGFKDVKVGFSGQPPDELIMTRSQSDDTTLAQELDDTAIRFNNLFFSSGNNVIIEAVK